MDAVGPYTVLGELARGGMGVVFRARDPRVGRDVAIKLIGGPTLDPDEVERLRREAEALARLRHPSVLRVHELGFEGGQPYLVTELIDGESLADRLKRGGPLPPPEAAELVEALARALVWVHESGVLHRDLKPANTLQRADGSLVLIDFGLARFQDARESLTQTGEVLGTPGYMAPEQIDRRLGEPSPATDVYGLGATLYELLSGAPPFRGGALLKLLQQVVSEPPPPLVGVDPGLAAICGRCLEKKPADRYSDMRAVVEALVEWRAGVRVRVRMAPVLVAAALAVVAVGVPGALLASGALTDPADSPAPTPEPTVAVVEEPAQEPPPAPPVEPPADVEPHAALRALVDEGEFAEAEAAIAVALRKDALAVEPRLLRAEIELYRPAIDVALEQLEALSREGHRSVELACALARGYRLQHRFRRAQAAGELAITLAPERAEGYVERAHASLAEGKWDHAQTWVARALELEPAQPRALHLRYELLRRQGKLEEAMELVRRGLRSNPRDRDLRSALAYLYWVRGDQETAVQTMRNLIAARPRDLETRRLFGYSLLGVGQLDEGFDELARVIEAWPRFSGALHTRALGYKNLDRVDEALADLDACLADNPTYPYALELRADMRVGRKQVDGALADLSTAVRARPDEARFWLKRGKLLLVLEHDYRAAVNDFDEAWRLNPKSAEVAYFRGVAQQKAGNLKEALDDFERAFLLEPKPPLLEEVVFAGATLLPSLNREGEAARYLQYFVDRYPEHARAEEARDMLRSLRGQR